MRYETLKYQVTDSILILTLNRPDHLNAFNLTMAEELVSAFNKASKDATVRCIVVTGSGKAFCAGMDLSKPGNVFGLDESLKPNLTDVQDLKNAPANLLDTGGKVSLAIYNCNKPVIAAINGAAIGVGATMTLAMDIRFASEKAKFGFVFAKIGITTEACSSWFLPRVVGISKALEWTMTGDIFDAKEALEGGLVRTITAPEDLVATAMDLARKIANNTSAVSVAMNRKMLYRNSALSSPEEAHKLESLSMFYTSIQDGKEGVASFLEKRPANLNQNVPEEILPFEPWK
ncbi:MAG: enoyl-CoA hydratase [Zetaproteobacteria bacterium]|nr:enoyl-CoA hydratase [Pseudobdellovibrionaceae bacterium]